MYTLVIFWKYVGLLSSAVPSCCTPVFLSFVCLVSSDRCSPAWIVVDLPIAVMQVRGTQYYVQGWDQRFRVWTPPASESMTPIPKIACKNPQTNAFMN
ncbi:hypothetical protein EJ06DRAFT_534192 [Trichodelitschia bisporula]|uniref:Uncharacterized protein n=1 Tax=Trichodelitschia bisporula TaxID=703511 RepID=A0A6G1HK73_9PEZI|nr:hypothetical protein EJ06DRAFT_534192 [Trichodelitschia bisporula]